jgi:hypothetical protein
MPVKPAGLKEGVAPSRPWVVTTFIAAVLSDEDIAELNADELAFLVSLPESVLREWDCCRERRVAEPESLRDAIANRGQATREQPAWLRTPKPDRNGFLIDLGDEIVLKVARGGRTRGARFVGVELTDGAALTNLCGEELAQAVRLDARALRDYRARGRDIPDDARGHLRTRIVAEGRLVNAMPEWATATWHGLVLVIGDDIALGLRPLQGRLLEATDRWSARHCWVR